MKRYRLDIFFVLGLLLLCLNCKLLLAQKSDSTSFAWVELEKGVSYCEIAAPERSILNDSKLTIVKIDPAFLEFKLLTATEYGNKLRTADNWSNEFNMEIIINAGMYSYNKNHSNKGYLKNYNHLNNPVINGYYNSMMVLNPVDTTDNSFQLVDLTCQPFDSIKNRYYSFCQGMRMLDCEGNPMAFEKNPTQSCSMILLSSDGEGMIYIVFTRSPYTHQKMIKFLKGLPLNLKQTVYLEGGPEASLFIKTKNGTISKYGSYVSKTWANDDNDHFWEIPNVIGIRRKKSF
jgi:hypothetical protein